MFRARIMLVLRCAPRRCRFSRRDVHRHTAGRTHFGWI